MPIFYLLFSLTFFTYASDKRRGSEEVKNILKNSSIEKLKNEIYYFPAKKTSSSVVVYQPLEQFDLIFTGHDVNTSIKNFDLYQNTSALIPGKYTHTMMYMGKDSNGYAYAVEMNADKDKTFSMDFHGMYIGGGFHLICLGSDYGKYSCPDDDDTYGLETYDYNWAKRLNPKLKNQLLLHKDQLLKIIKKDLVNTYPFQIPFDLTMMTAINKVTHLIEDEHVNGSDCVSYFVSLFEEVAHVCFEDIRIDAPTLQAYYLNDPLGQRAVLPAKYNPTSDKDILVKDLLGNMGFSFADQEARKTSCPDGRRVKGVPTPNLLFNSADMENIDPIQKEKN